MRNPRFLRRIDPLRAMRNGIMALRLRPAAALPFLFSLTALTVTLAPACGSSEPLSLFDAGVAPDTSAPVLPPPGSFGDAGDGDGGDGGGFDLDGGCAKATAEARRIPVYMMLVIDGSGSMDGFDGTAYVAGEREIDPETTTPRLDLTNQATQSSGKKWIAVRGALKSFFDGLVAKPDPSLAVGLYLFSSTAAKPTALTDVAVGYVDATQASALKGRLSPPVYAAQGTPLAAAVRGQRPLLVGYTPVAPVLPGGKYVMVMMTDGVPNSGNLTQPQANADVIAAINETKAGTPSATVFVVGVGNPTARIDQYDELFLGQAAQAGGAPEPGCNATWSDTNLTGKPCHFQVTPGAKTAAQIKDDFLAAINQIREKVASCEFTLEKPQGAGALDPTKVNVLYTNGAGVEAPIPQNAANGWTYDNPTDPTKVILNGKSCTDVKADPDGKIRIVIGCKTIVTK